MRRIGSARGTPASFLLSDSELVISRSSSRWLAAAWFLIFWPALCLCQPPDRGILCRGGSGTFEAEFHTGISVHIGAARDRGLATRACAAKLSWEKQELLVATGASQLDLDAFGADLGEGAPVAAFLAEMWPPADLDRIRTALLKTRALGIHSEAESASSGLPAGGKKHAHIFDAVSRSGAARSLDVIPPKAILLEFPPTSENQPGRSEPMLLDLIVDAAGKVRSAEAAGPLKSAAQDRIAMALTWKFIPAFKDGRAVASRLRMSVSPKQ